jgi:hypothetical protein
VSERVLGRACRRHRRRDLGALSDDARQRPLAPLRVRIAITAASAMAGCAISAFSRSTDDPAARLDQVLVRSVMRTKPSSSIAATSPVRSQPSSLNLSSLGAAR